LIILAFVTNGFIIIVKSYWATALLVLLVLVLPVFILLVWSNPYVRVLLYEGWTATFLSMTISRYPLRRVFLI
jgi:hypothetical protein